MTALAEPRTITETAIGTDWESLTNAGTQARKFMDDSKFFLGDLAGLVTGNHGENALGKYATDIEVNVATLRGYERVSGFYPSSARAYNSLSWSHYRLAIRAGDKALAFLAECDKNGWSVSEANRELVRREGKPVPPKKLWDGKLRVVRFEDEWTVLLNGVSIADLGAYEGREIQVVIHEAK